jgi:hypothetical protein
MLNEQELIQRQMSHTRGALTEKLEALEGQVADTVSATTDAVHETTEAVKETVATVTEKVQETVQSVGESLSLSVQMERHPWLVLGGAVAVGCVVGASFGSPAEASARPASQPSQAPPPPPPWNRAVSEPAEHGIWHDAVSHLRDIGVSYLMGVVRDLARNGMPGELGNRVAKEVDALTTKMGAEPIRGPVLPDWKPGPAEKGQPDLSASQEKPGSVYRGRSPVATTAY